MGWMGSEMAKARPVAARTPIEISERVNVLAFIFIPWFLSRLRGSNPGSSASDYREKYVAPGKLSALLIY
jgi:hypothetical protein